MWKCKPLLQTSQDSLFFRGRDELDHRLLSVLTRLFSPLCLSVSLLTNLVEKEGSLGEGKRTCVHVGARDQFGVLFLKSHPPLETVSLTRAWGLPNKLSQASKALRSSCPCLPAHTGCLPRVLGTEAHPHAHPASTLPTKPSPHPAPSLFTLLTWVCCSSHQPDTPCGRRGSACLVPLFRMFFSTAP